MDDILKFTIQPRYNLKISQANHNSYGYNKESGQLLQIGLGMSNKTQKVNLVENAAYTKDIARKDISQQAMTKPTINFHHSK